MSKNFSLTVLGARGSMPIDGKNFVRYGGATSCYKILAGDEEIYLDAGSGIVKANPQPKTRITILLSHLHLDHIIGLPFFVALGQKNRPIDIYAKARSGLSAQDALSVLISPPFWPLKIKSYPANVNFNDLPQKNFSIGEVSIETLDGKHPQGSTIFRLTFDGKILVYATDFEHTPAGCEKLANFARDCDLLLYDAQYTEDEYKKFRGYGHSTPEEGLKVAELAAAKKILFIHHSPCRNDDELADLERKISARNEKITFAKVGDEIFL